MLIGFLLLFLQIFFLQGCIFNQVGHYDPSKLEKINKSSSFAITNVKIFDGREIINKGTVVVKDTKIYAVGTDVKIPNDAEIFNGYGLTLLPGLIDSHTHILDEHSLKRALVFGVTTELDMSMLPETAKRLKKQISSDNGIDIADFFTAGNLFTAPGGHGTQFVPFIQTINQPEQAESLVNKRISEGSDYIKIVYDHIIYPDYLMPTITKKVLSTLIDSAHKKNKLAVVHIGTMNDAIDAIESGADGLVHLNLDGKYNNDFGRIVAKQKAFVIPTLTLFENVRGIPGSESLLNDPYLFPYISPGKILEIKDYVRLSYPFVPPAKDLILNESSQPNKKRSSLGKMISRTIKQLKENNVLILAGTDAIMPGILHGLSIHRELELLVEAGLSANEALAAATSNPAEAFKMNTRGRILPGYRADLLLVNGDPTTDIKDTRKILSVWKLGVALDRSNYLDFVDNLKEQEKIEKKRPAPRNSENGLVSNFDNNTNVEFGHRWVISTDSFLGGNSVAEMEITEDGANESKGSLLISGHINEGFEFPWAGVMFSPGDSFFGPSNLSSKKGISFWAKGEMKKYTVCLFALKIGDIPACVRFKAAKEWNYYTIPFSLFKNFDGIGMTSLTFGGNAIYGKFEFQIDDVRFY